jgi:hypothetical protein
MSEGAPVEEIGRLAGHSSSRTTEVVYRPRTPAGDHHGRRGDGQDLVRLAPEWTADVSPDEFDVPWRGYPAMVMKDIGSQHSLGKVSGMPVDR